jgi:hypothetical protein
MEMSFQHHNVVIVQVDNPKLFIAIKRKFY